MKETRLDVLAGMKGVREYGNGEQMELARSPSSLAPTDSGVLRTR